MRKLMLATVALCGMLCGCGGEPVPPFARALFSAAKGGAKVSMPFVVPPTAPLTHTYMLSFNFVGPEVGDPPLMFWKESRHEHLFLKVRLVSLDDDGKESDVALTGYDFGDGGFEIAHMLGPDIFDVELSGTRPGVGDPAVALFKLPRHGSYRFDVEVLHDLEHFDPLVSWLTIEHASRM